MTASTVAAAAQRVGLAARLDQTPRMPWSTLLDTTATVDALAQDLRDQIQAAGPAVTPEQVDRLVSMSRAAHAMAESLVRLGLVRLTARLRAHELAATRAVLVGTFEQLMEHLGVDEPEVGLWAIRSFQRALAALDGASRPLDERPSREAEEESTREARLLELVRAAVKGVSWELDFVICSKADREELERLRRVERERAAAARPQSVTSVMTLPGSPAGYRPPGPLPALPAAAARADGVEEDDEPFEVAPGADPLPVVGRVVDGPGTRWPFPSVFNGNGWRP